MLITCSNSAPTDPFVGSMDFYHFNMALSGACAVISIVAAVLLLFRHATHFSRPKQQLEYAHSQPAGSPRPQSGGERGYAFVC